MARKFISLVIICFYLYVYYQYNYFKGDLLLFYQSDTMTIWFAVLIGITTINYLIYEIRNKIRKR